LVGGDRLLFAIDDTRSKRYGPAIQGAGIHHNPTPGPGGENHFYGHLWVSLAWLALHPLFGVLALPLVALLYVRAKDVPELNQQYPWTLKTKLEQAGELLQWLLAWLLPIGKAIWLVVDGAYAKAPLLRPMRQLGVVVVSRLRQDAALWSLPEPKPHRQRGP